MLRAHNSLHVVVTEVKPSSGEMSGDVAATVSSQFYSFLPATAQPSLEHNMHCMATRFHRENYTWTNGLFKWTRPGEIHVHAFSMLSWARREDGKVIPTRSLSRRRGAASANCENFRRLIEPNGIANQGMKEIVSYSQKHRYCFHSDLAAKSSGVQSPAWLCKPS